MICDVAIKSIKYQDPISFFEPFSTSKNAVLLTGAGAQNDIAEFSLIGIHPSYIFSWDTINKDKTIFWRELKDFFQKLNFDAFPFPANRCGAIGYLSYEARQYCELLPQNTTASYNIPISYFCLYHIYYYFEHNSKTLYEISISYENPEIEKETTNVQNKKPKNFLVEALETEHSEQSYIQNVEKVKSYIRSGDVYEVNLSQQIKGRFAGNSYTLFQKLYEINDAPYSAFMNYDFAKILCNSPELFLRCVENKVETRPIKGTIKRETDAKKDAESKAKLLQSKKDQAELFMIIDLMRNDLSRCAKVGSVKVKEEKRIEQYKNVWHLVGIIESELKERTDYIDLLRATFPGGSITGCPKIRCMEIIDELEQYQRQLYTGSILVMNREYMNANIVIRTSIIQQDKIFMNSGGAVTIDSDPKSEYEETLDKIQSHLQSFK